jgi:hypothetical protein
MKVLQQLLDVIPRLVNNLLSIVIDGFGVETGIDSRYGSFLSQYYSENTPSSTRNPAWWEGTLLNKTWFETSRRTSQEP